MTYGNRMQWKRTKHTGDAAPVQRYARIFSGEEAEGMVDFPYLSFPLLEQTGIVDHLFTTRLGGVSEGIYATTNLSFSMQDNPEAVRENYRRIAQALNTDIDHMVVSHQTHTTNVRLVTEQDLGKGIVTERDYQNVDGKLLEEPYLTEKSLGGSNIELPYQVPDNRYFCMGDHRSTSVDSRHTEIGCVSEEQIVGKIVFRVFPLREFGKLK